MPAELHTNDTLLITLVSRYCGQICMNTYVYRCLVVSGNPPAVAGMNKLLDFIDGGSNLRSTLAGCMPQNCTIYNMWGQVIRPTRLRAIKRTIDSSGLFTETDGLTANVQASIERYGETANRRSVGAIRVPIGTDDSCFDDGELTPAMKTALEAHAATMDDTFVISDTGWQFRAIPAVGLPKLDLDLIDCVGTLVQDTTRVIRRRTVRVGI